MEFLLKDYFGYKIWNHSIYDNFSKLQAHNDKFVINYF